MKHAEKVAIARILSDMVKADSVIDEIETNLLYSFFGENSRYKLNYDILRESRSIRFSDAVAGLKDLSLQEKRELYSQLTALAMADKVCVPSEANLLLAIKYCLGLFDNNDEAIESKMVSCPCEGLMSNRNYVIYIEREIDEKLNKEIADNLQLISLILNRFGYDFIYIPKIVEDFKKVSREHVKGVLKFIVPDLSDAKTNEVYDRMCELTTSTFTTRVLVDKLGMLELHNTEPLLLVKTATSVIPYYSTSNDVEYYSDFLSLKLQGGIIAVLENLARYYSNIASPGAIVNTNYFPDISNVRFKYFGFYKSILDFVLKAEGKVGKVVFCPYTSSVYIPEIHSEVELSPQECSVYYLIAFRSIESQGVPSCYTNKKEMNELKRLYKKVYSYKSDREQEFPSVLAPIVSKINKKLKIKLKSLMNLSSFLIANVDGFYVINAREDELGIANVPSKALNNIEIKPILTML